MRINVFKCALLAGVASVGGGLTMGTSVWAGGDCQVKMNEVCYGDFSSAIAGLGASTEEVNTIVLMNDIVNAETSNYNIGKNLVIDLNGRNYTANNRMFIQGGTTRITGDGQMILGNVTPIRLEGSDNAVAERYTNLIVDDEVTLHASYDDWSYMIGAYNNSKKYGINVDFYGKITQSDEAKCGAFYTNGSVIEGTIEYNVMDSAEIETYTGAYIAGTTTMNFSGAMNVVNNGIEIRAGELNVNGGMINVESEIPYSVISNGSGSTTEGTAVAVAQHTTKLPVNLNIYEGSLKAVVPVSQTNPENNSAEELARVTGHIYGGKFITLDGVTIYSTDWDDFISGGIYNRAPDNSYLADRYLAYSAGDNYVVLPEITTDGEDEIDGQDAETTRENKEVLSRLAEEAISAILWNYEELSDGAVYTLAEGTKIRIDDADNLKGAIGEGKTIKVKLVEDYMDVEGREGELEALRNGVKEGGFAVGIMDYNVILTADGYGDLAHVTELDEPLTLTYDMTGVDKVTSGFKREYQVVRYHEGVTDSLDEISYDDAANVLNFATDKFSGFLIAVIDTEIVIEEDTADGNASGTLYGVPNTGVSGGTASSGVLNGGVVAAVAMGLGYVGNVLRRKVQYWRYRK